MIEYEKINLNPQTEKKPCGCKETKKDCSCNNKIDIKNNCAMPQCFKVDNYFSELVHNWEKEAARYNLGIQELEGIEYVTENNNGELLTKVIFKYRQGHELITREFYCAPAGPEGKPGKDGRDGDTGPQGPKGDKGDIPTLNKVILTWVNSCDEEGGRFIEDCLNNGYNLELKLKRPDVFEELAKILDLINEQLTLFYAKKSDLLDYVKNNTFNNVITDLMNRISSAGAEYRLEYNEPWLYLTKDDRRVSSIKLSIASSGSSLTIFTGLILVFKLGSKSLPSGNYTINGSDWTSKGWTLNVPSLDVDDSTSDNDYVWMALCYVNNGIYGEWQYSRLTGEHGEDGEDSEGREFIYKLTSTSLNPGKPVLHIDDNNKPYAEDWQDHPIGVDETNRWEWMSMAIKDSNNQWNEFTYPALWSHYGKDGKDGDGVEYIFLLTENEDLLEGNINPATWDAVQTNEYRGPQGSNWTDNPGLVKSDLPILWVSKRKRLNGIWQKFSNPTIWNRYTSPADPNIIILVTPQLVTYINGLSALKTITVSVYYGTLKLQITNIKNGNEDVTLNNGTFTHVVDINSNETFTVYFTLNNESLSRTFKLEKAEIPSSTSGTSPVYYDMIIDPGVIAFDEKTDTLVTDNIDITVYKIQGDTRTSFTSGELTYLGSWENATLVQITNRKIDVSSIDHKWFNGEYLTVLLEVDGTMLALATIPCIKNAQTTTSPYIIRNRGAWKSGISYENQTIADENELNVGDIKFIDVVSNDVLTLDAQGELSNTTLTYYMPKVRNTTSDEWKDSEWKEAYALDFAFIKTLISEVILAKSVQANEVLVTNEDSIIVAGMTSGNKLNSEEDDSIRIWAGTSLNVDNLKHVDLTNAPFRVYLNGKVVAEDITLTGSADLKQLLTNQVVTVVRDVSYKDYTNYNMYFAYIEADKVSLKYELGKRIILGTDIIDEDGNYPLKQGCIYIFLNRDEDFIVLQITSEKIISNTMQIILNDSEFNFTSDSNDHQDSCNFTVPNSISPDDERFELDSSINSISPKAINIKKLSDINYYCTTYYDWDSSTNAFKRLAGCVNSNNFSDSRVYEDNEFYTGERNDNLPSNCAIDATNFIIHPRFSLKYKYIENEISVYWFGEKKDGLPILYVRTDTCEGRTVLSSENPILFNDYGNESFYLGKYESGVKKFLKDHILTILCDVTRTASYAPKTEVLPNGTIIHAETNLVVGYTDGTEVTSYYLKNFLINHNGVWYTVPSGTQQITITSLESLDPDPKPLNP